MTLPDLVANAIVTFCNRFVFRPKYQLGQAFATYNLCVK